MLPHGGAGGGARVLNRPETHVRQSDATQNTMLRAAICTPQTVAPHADETLPEGTAPQHEPVIKHDEAQRLLLLSPSLNSCQRRLIEAAAFREQLAVLSRTCLLVRQHTIPFRTADLDESFLLFLEGVCQQFIEQRYHLHTCSFTSIRPAPVHHDSNSPTACPPSPLSSQPPPAHL